MAQPQSARRSFLDALPESDRAALLEAGRLREWRHGEPLVRAGDRADSAILLLGGLVKIHRIGAEGAEVILGLCGPGELLGEIAVLQGAIRSATATALGAVRAVVVPVSDLRAFLAARPRTTLALLELALGRLQVADRRRVEFATSESLARVASRLVELAERFGERRDDGAIDVVLPISQEELASWSASSKESTARALRTLRALHLIETRRLRLTVLDIAGLRGHAGDA
ncbi:MAG: Crp/Fnr family transcriptional regulator [Solirubrobacteraceae bacterium]